VGFEEDFALSETCKNRRKISVKLVGSGGCHLQMSTFRLTSCVLSRNLTFHLRFGEVVVTVRY